VTPADFNTFEQRLAAVQAAYGSEDRDTIRSLTTPEMAATRVADLGVQAHVVEAVLNHASGHKAGVRGVYNRSLYSAEKRIAMELQSIYL
jgi:predicted lipid-binding transport protein (Tim44 family)